MTSFARLLFLFVLLAAPLARADELVVVTHPIPPFVIKNADGTWSGISMDVWRRVADELKLQYRIEEVPIPDLFTPEKTGADVVVSLNITSRSESLYDLSHAFYMAGLGIAVRRDKGLSFSAVASRLASARFGQAVMSLFGVLVLMGVVVWRLERRTKPDEFGGSPLRGIGRGVFWSFESVVGKAPSLTQTLTNRIVILLWTGLCVLFVSGLTAGISAELTASRLLYAVNGPNDLQRVKVGCVQRGSLSTLWLESRGVDHRVHEDTDAALQALERGEVDAVVYEMPVLQYAVTQRHAEAVTVLAGTFRVHGYGFALRQGSPLREAVNQAVLRLTDTGVLQQIFTNYLGASAQ
jgi:polar amino acid transport system substrate-binding protein